MNPGIAYALGAYVVWGLFPLYFHLLESVPAPQILAHRMVWSALLVLLILLALRRWSWLRVLRERPAVVGRFAASALVLSCNWLTYIWSVNNGHVVEASLGYYINPLMNVALGTVLLHERMRALQWAAVAVAASGVLWMAFGVGHMPWLALILAVSFSSYSLLRKIAPLGSLEGLALETAVLLPVALLYLGWTSLHGDNAFALGDLNFKLLLMASGPVTAIPLLMFAAGARRIPFSLLGILQYTTPTLLLVLGVTVYHEAFGASKVLGFGLVWAGIGLYLAEGMLRRRRPAGVAA
ncbi:EamA family transporter RarD [Thiomonas sp.]|jgi:chloramphenicol-sensitive protein RarD|uniref:EamA family transporter RarD n=1 Tax=Thiomonas sp. TaxID=2047785 RepID=UPI00261BEFA8|nr:EamA family transporter RarD [Thiomonas sp.]